MPFGTFGDGQYNVILYHDKSFIHLFLNILSVPFSPLLSKLHFGLPGFFFPPRPAVLHLWRMKQKIFFTGKKTISSCPACYRRKKCMKRRIGTKNKLSIRIHEKFFHKNGSRSIIHCSSACFPILPCPESMT
ncbi:hypothetical protein DMI80_02120 [Akkermansia muciniphila]|nr:hypothetical protein DMI71_01995 [Akkermansia muciniphila]QHV55080.1 hypothetical protein DMI72_02040 [Akkermansia muciniphila]QHV57457.1 hypothetical protein DMI73_02005 [Akkermansia muciniphila]QHV60822.1 hypothetical protein DMI74_07700 [Akkermansia muciniphila]QHV64783.1 hypothetical protein DMI78_02115 [Akkermansia muciniphila]